MICHILFELVDGLLFPAGEACAGVFDMTPGDYVLFCAIVEEEPDGTVENHYELGMKTQVTVS